MCNTTWLAHELEECGMKKAKKLANTEASAVDLAPFDASEFLDNEEVIAEYVAVALEDPNPDAFLRAVANVTKARGAGSS
jgi:broad-specificity NMP kinase